MKTIEVLQMIVWFANRQLIVDLIGQQVGEH